MCGIAGTISLDGTRPDEDLVRRMTACLVHRGPDGEGRFASVRVAFGHRRLAILDLARGGQPMVSASGDSVLVHNGEIYNSPSLRAELARDGRVFRTHADTEVLLEGLEAEGRPFLDRLNGIFAFAWHHQPTGRTLLARDPFGVKPLYYHRNPQRLLFASEIRALLVDPSIHPALDPDELTVLLTLRYSPSPGTLLKGIRKLPPGHLLAIRGSSVEEIRYDLPFAPDAGPGRSFGGASEGRSGSSLGAMAEAYARGLRESVGRQMLSDVPLGVFLSGGIDSSAIAALMRERAPSGSPGSAGLTAFTVGFEEPGRSFPFDERAAAGSYARELDLPHECQVCTPEAFSEALPGVVAAMEEPVGSASAVPYWLLSRHAARSHKVVLAGQGADEPHGGYPRYQGVLLAQAAGRLLPGLGGEWITRRLRGRVERLRRGLALLGQRDPGRLLLETYRHFPQALLRSLVRPEWAGSPELAAERIARWREPAAHLDPLGQMMHVDARMWLPDDLLLYGDKLSMAHGLEVRVPYLDRELMRLVESVPRPWRVGVRRPKRLHRLALERILPPTVTRRRKLGFDTPVDGWFRTLWVPELPRWLWGSGSFLPSIFRVETMREMVEEHRSGRADHRRRLYTLLALEFWGRAFL